ncbi:hypothetical protein HHX47_DHR2000152 [Lentinula edodes]|nr:hypothetical protein HHX47_DHR2000152 [Lentinula edodes]
MIAYLLYNADFFDITFKLRWQGLSVGFVDDKNILVEGKSLTGNVEMLEFFMDKPGGGFSWAAECSSSFGLSKLVLICFPRPKIKPEAPLLALVLQGTAVTEKTKVRMLGITIDSKLKWNKQAAQAAAKALSIASAFWKLSRPSTGVSLKMMRKLYLTVVIPKMTYGLDVWYTPPHRPEGAKSRRGSLKALQNFTQIQHMVTITTSGAMGSSPTDLLDIHTNLLPMDLMLEKICHWAILRIYTLPDENPVVKITQTAFQQRRVEKMAPPLRLLPRIFGLPSPETVETITPPQRAVQWTSPVETRILKKDDTSQSPEEDSATYKIFSDGSGYGGMTGTAVVLYKNGRPLTNAVL